MNKVIFSIGFLLILIPVSVSLAAAPLINNPIRPYEPLAIDADIDHVQIYLGELSGDPHMYEVTVGEEKEFVITLMQEAEAGTMSPSFILVKENAQNRGVTEIGRVDATKATWETYRDPNFALSFRRTEAFRATISPGVYRFEVSTPENEGKYMLLVGHEANSDGYFTELSHIRFVQKFFGHSIFLMFLSAYVLYPIGIAIVIYLLYFTWSRGRRMTPHA
jgi:hypothetical protein